MDRFEIESVTTVYDGFFRVDDARVRYELPDGTMSDVQPRLCVERGDSASVLLHDRSAGELLFVRQFRYPCVSHGHPFLLEIVAGKVDPGENPEEAARREAMEEVGIRVEQLQKVGAFYSSPGGMSELNHVFYATFSASDVVAESGGLDQEGVQLVRLPIQEALRMLHEGEIHDGKAMVALQWFALNIRG